MSETTNHVGDSPSCPSCGYCPHCGRGRTYPVAPYYPIPGTTWPYYPQYPYWFTYTTAPATDSPNISITPGNTAEFG